MPMNIALDGPVGAGKSTISDMVAQRLGILHLDTGAMYRAAGLLALRTGCNLEDEAACTHLVENMKLSVAYKDGLQQTLLEGEDVSGSIRTPEVSMAASAISRWGGVRRRMVALQQELASLADMLIDGRDIGLRVLPEARVKVYLTAEDTERARRRTLQMKESGVPADYEQVLRELRERDWQDMHREADPLQVAPGAVVVDSTNMSMEEVAETIARMARKAYGRE